MAQAVTRLPQDQGFKQRERLCNNDIVSLNWSVFRPADLARSDSFTKRINILSSNLALDEIYLKKLRLSRKESRRGNNGVFTSSTQLWRQDFMLTAFFPAKHLAILRDQFPYIDVSALRRIDGYQSSEVVWNVWSGYVVWHFNVKSFKFKYGPAVVVVFKPQICRAHEATRPNNWRIPSLKIRRSIFHIV